ncbi:MAG: hypothetical protein Q9174_007007, partial [Haloplaca sp. 1 TL-2023]
MSVTNGRPIGNGAPKSLTDEWDRKLRAAKEYENFHGDELLADKQSKPTGMMSDLWKILTPQNAPEVLKVAYKSLSGQGLD